MTRWIVFVAAALAATAARGENVELATDSPAIVIDEAAASEWITSIVRELLPAEYEDTRDWGKTKRVLDGWKIDVDGLQIKTKRRWKDANHGTWKRYRVRPINPAEEFQLRVQNIRRQENGSVAFDLTADAHLAVMGRISQWQWDVQVFSFSAEGTARVRLTAQCELAMRLDPRKLPPDLVLLPKVVSADVHLAELRLDRISKADGPLVEEIGRGMRQAVREKLEHDRGKIADKFNRQIAKKEDKLRLSLQDALASKWARWIDAEAIPETP
jgi:hypothetical protein